MRSRLVLALLGAMAAATVTAVVPAWTRVVSAGSPAQRSLVVDSNLVIGAGQLAMSAVIPLDGFASWTAQVTVRTGDAASLEWRIVYRFRSDLDWVPYFQQFATPALRTQIVFAPEAAIEFHNRSANPIRAAISAVMYDRLNAIGDYHVVSTQVLMGAGTVQIAGGQEGVSEAFDLGSANSLNTQMQFVSARTTSNIQVDTEWKIFNPQDFVNSGAAGVNQNTLIYGPVDVQTPKVRYRIHNFGPDFIEVKFAVYALTTD
ncbi:MAG: hypothetical protein HYR85_10920 [Planctomycetes bacterium]|nr:hypothetical protein [Planctomycetota bacterium]MBI3847273.1 hypothetical protein [Planctomycetota bacterium]